MNVYDFDIGNTFFSCERITQKFYTPSKIQGTISQSNRCLTHLTKLIVGQSGEIYGVTPISWEDSPWKQLSLVGEEEVISLSHAKVHVFSDSVLCLGKMNQNPESNTVWEDKLTWFKSSSKIQNFGHN